MCSFALIVVVGVLVLASPPHIGAAATPKYFPLEGCAVEEGETLSGPHRQCDVTCCRQRCDRNPRCHSFSMFGVAKVCYLKDRCIAPTDAVKVNK